MVGGARKVWASLSAGSFHTCGVTWAGAVRCWGQNYAGQADPPAETEGWRDVSASAGFYHTCGLALPVDMVLLRARLAALPATNATHNCSTAAPGATAVVRYCKVLGLANGTSVLLLTKLDLLRLYDSRGALDYTDPRDTAVSTMISLRGNSYSEETAASQLVGVTFLPIPDVVAPLPPTVQLGPWCWGDNSHGQTRVPSDARCANGTSTLDCSACFNTSGAGAGCPVCGGGLCRRTGWAQVSAGQWHSCGVLSTGEALCWGDNGFGQAAVEPLPSGDGPGAQWVSIHAGHYHTCGLTRTGSLRCWGSNMYGATRPPALPAGLAWTAVGVGRYHTCGLGSDGRARCWGDEGLAEDEASGAAAVPADLAAAEWASISAGLMHTCGVLADGTGRCWGRPTYQATAVPQTGRFATA
jgi:hypothetical protein